MDYNIKKHNFVWSRDLSRRSEPAIERGSFVSLMNESFALDQHGKHILKWH